MMIETVRDDNKYILNIAMMEGPWSDPERSTMFIQVV